MILIKDKVFKNSIYLFHFVSLFVLLYALMLIEIMMKNKANVATTPKLNNTCP